MKCLALLAACWDVKEAQWPLESMFCSTGTATGSEQLQCARSVICLVCVLLAGPHRPCQPVSNCLMLLSLRCSTIENMGCTCQAAGQPAGKCCGDSEHEWLQVAAAFMLCIERSSRENCLCSGPLEVKLFPGHSSSTFTGQVDHASWCLLPERLRWTWAQSTILFLGFSCKYHDMPQLGI